MAKNLEVVGKQWDAYKAEVSDVIIPGIAAAPWKRKPHKTAAFIEEWFDKMPRLNYYLLVLWVPAQVWLIWTALA